MNIYERTITKVANGSKFSVDLKKRSLKVGHKYLIKNGYYEGELGCPPYNCPLYQLERLYQRYKHSVPSQRSELKRRRYFRALPMDELSDDDMLYGIRREEAQAELEVYLLCQLIHGTISWNDFAEGKWFWQSPTEPSLILLKEWITI